ncbi:hypothetical protein [Nostoc sp. DSM 114160]
MAHAQMHDREIAFHPSGSPLCHLATSQDGKWTHRVVMQLLTVL